MLATGQDGRPSAGARIAVTPPIGVNDDFFHAVMEGVG